MGFASGGMDKVIEGVFERVLRKSLFEDQQGS